MINEIFYVLNSGCSQCCKGCYLASQKKYKSRDYEQALQDIKTLKNKARHMFLTGSDTAGFKGVENLLSFSDQGLILGNIFSISKHRDALEAIAKNTNVKFVMITSQKSSHTKTDDNADRLTKNAASTIRKSGLEPVLTFVIGKSNYRNIEACADEAIKNDVRYARFIRYIPLDKRYKDDFMEDSHMKEFLSQIKFLREKIPKDKLYIRIDGLFGTEWRKEKGKTCSAGQNDFLIGLDNNIYPCEFLIRDEFILGRFENGAIKLKGKLVGLSDYDCKAKQIFGEGKKPSIIKVDERI